LVKKAVVSSFSPVINEPMRDYLERGCQFLAACDRYQVGNLVNDTIGKHLPSLFKRFNYRHVSSLDSHEYAQMHFHINQVLTRPGAGAEGARNINIPVLFINGDRDEYTTVEDARQFSKHVGQSHFSVIREPATSSTWSTRAPVRIPARSCSVSSSRPCASPVNATPTRRGSMHWPSEAGTCMPGLPAGSRLPTAFYDIGLLIGRGFW
jgi:hypothetical protein